MTAALGRLRELADRTPQRRQRHVDLLRAAAIVLVVLGHWLVVVVTYDDAGLDGFSALEVLTWAHPVTWLFQVMPLFFLVGGFANAASLAAHRRRGGDAVGWLAGRGDRLVRPTSLLLAVLAAAALGARVAGADPDQIGAAVWVASIPLWFLVAYLTVVVLTPVTHALHRRAGLAVPSVLLVLIVAGDVARLASPYPDLSEANHLLVWLALHQVGFAWQDGRLPAEPRVGVPLAAIGFAALLLLVTVGPYPVSMVTVPGEPVQNVSPPTLALLALGVTQIGLALALRDRSERWLRRPRPWLAVVAVNSTIFTLFLWHMTALVLTTLVLRAVGLLPDPPVDSAAWLAWQLPWVVLLALVLVALVALVGRVESRRAGPVELRTAAGRAVSAALARPVLPAVLTLAGFAVLLLGLLGIGMAGRADHGPFGLPTDALALYLAGATLLRLARLAGAGASSGDRGA